MKLKDIIYLITGKVELYFKGGYITDVELPNEMQWLEENINWALDQYVREIYTDDSIITIELTERGWIKCITENKRKINSFLAKKNKGECF